MNTRKMLLRSGKWAGIGLLALLLMVAVLLALLQTPLVKRHAGAWISAVMSRGEDLHVIIPRIEGFVPFNFQLPRVTVEDRRGEWLVLEGVLVRWSPAALLRGKIRINDVTARQVQWARMPMVSTSGQHRRSPSWRLPPALPPVVLERIVIQKLLLGESILGRRASFLVSGQMKTVKAGDSVFGFLRLQRTDGPRSLVRISGSLTGKERLLALDARVEEDKKGLLAHVLSLPVTGPLVLTLKGRGPIGSWTGQLHGSAQGLGSVRADIAFSEREDRLRIMGTGLLGLSPDLMGPKVSPFMTPFMKRPEVHFSIGMGLGHSGEIILQKSYIKTDLAGLSLSGRFAPEKGDVEGWFHFQMPQTNTLTALAGVEVHGRLEATGRILGSIQKPETAVSLTLKGPRIGEFGASRVSLDLRAAALGKGLSGFHGLALEGSGKINGLQYPAVRDLVRNSPIRWSLKGRWSRGGPLSVEDLQVSGGPVHLRLSGDADLETLGFKGRAFGDIQDLGILHIPGVPALSGKAQIWADLRGNLPEKALSAKTRGLLRNLHGLQPLVSDLAGDQVRFEGDLDLKQFRHLNIRGLKILSETAQLSVNGALDLEGMDSKVQGHLTIPRLSMIPFRAGPSLKGSLEADIAMEGPLRAPRVVVRADGRNVAFRSVRFDRIRADLDMEALPQGPRGDVHLRMSRKTGQSLHAEASFAAEKGGMRISGLTLRSGGAGLSGHLLVHGSGPTLEGTLRSEANLADLAWVLGEGWGGNARATVRFSQSGGRQDIDYAMSGTGVRSPYGQASRLSVKGRIEDAFALGNVRADIGITGFQKDDVHLQAISMKAQGNMDRFVFSGRASGLRNQDFELETHGVCDLAQDRITMQVNELQGHYRGYPFSLQEPLVIRRGPEGYAVEKARFQLGQGQLRASSRFGEGVLLLDIDFQTLPLGILPLPDGRELLGLATGRVSLRGTPTSPEAKVQIALEKVKLKGPRFQKLPAVGISVQAQYGQHRFRTQLTLKGISPRPVEAELEIPAEMSLSPPALALLKKGEVRARLRGDLDLSSVPGYLALEDQTLRGRLSVNITAAGRPGDLRWAGSLILAHGAYENTRMGTILKDIQARAGLVDGSLILEKASATDGAAGSLSLRGRVKLSQKDQFPYQLKATLKDCLLIRTEDLTAHAAGDLTLSGSLQSASLTGNVTVGPAELRIPERMPPDVPSMKVTEINFPKKAGPPPEQSPWKFPAKVGLDVHLDLPGRVFVRGRGLESEWKGTLRVSGNTQSPLLKGALRIVRGNFNFFGKIFSLTGGTIQFNGSTPPAPRMNITAVYTRAGLTARIILSGTPAAPHISMESDPPLPTDEILSRVFFGRGMSEISPLQALRIAAAANTIAGGGGKITDFMDKARGFLGVDSLGLTGSGGGTEGTALTAGKYLSDKVYLKAQQGLKANSGKVSVDVEITPNISVESETGADASAGVGINWKWQY